MIDQRISYRYGGDTMGGRNDRSVSRGGGGADLGRSPDDRSSAQQTANTKAAISSARADRDDVREQYRLDNPVVVGETILAPDFTKVGTGSTMDDNRILAMNLSNRPFKAVNVPPYIPGSTAINFLGNLFGGFGYEANKKFFQENIAGKKGYGYGYEDFKNYMQDRGLDKVDAYGNPVTRETGGDNPLQHILYAQQLANPTFVNPTVEPLENLQGGVAQLYNQYLQNLGSL